MLDKVGLTDDLIEAGRKVAATMTEMFADLPPDHEFFEQFSFISAEELPEFAAILSAADSRRACAGAAAGAARKLLSLPFKLIAARHRLDLLDERDAAAAARSAARLPPRPAGGGAAARSSSSIPSATTPRHRCRTTSCSARSPMARPMRRCGCPALISELLDAMSLRATVVDVGLNYEVGTGGSRLSLAQRQRAAIARALLKRPDLLDPQRGDDGARRPCPGQGR